MTSIISSVGFSSDPLTKYKDFREAIHSRAATLCGGLHDGGLAGMGHHMTDEEFTEWALEQDPPHTGGKIICLRPAALAPGASTGATNIYKFAREDYQAFTNGYGELRSEILASVGPIIEEQLNEPGVPASVKSISTIISHIKHLYGKVTVSKHSGLKAKLPIVCKDDLDVLNHCQRLSKLFRLLEDMRDPVGELSKMEYLVKGIAYCRQSKVTIADYVREVPDMNERTYDGMVERLTVAAPNFITEETNRPNLGYGAFGQDSGGGSESELKLVLAAVTALQADVNKMKKYAQVTQNTPAGTSIESVPNTGHYCFLHGYGKKHNGKECRSMKTGYTQGQICATGPGLIDGKVGKN